MKAGEIATRAAQLVDGDREQTHGDKRRNMDNIANVWNAWLAIRRDPSAPLSGRDASVMMSLLKIARMETGEKNLDDATDAIGYISIAGHLDHTGS